MKCMLVFYLVEEEVKQKSLDGTMPSQDPPSYNDEEVLAPIAT